MDAADVLTQSEETILFDQLLTLNEETAVEMACVVVDGVGEQSIQAYTDELLWRWEVGLPGVFNGLVLVIDTEGRQVHLSRGDGIRWNVTDEDLDAFMDEVTEPLSANDYFGGLRTGIDAITRLLAGVTWEVAYFDLASLPREGAEGAVVSFSAAVQGVRGDTVQVLHADSIQAAVLLLPDTTPLIMEDVWQVYGRVHQRSPLQLLLLGVEDAGLPEEMYWN